MPHHAELPLWDDKSSEQKIETMRRMIDDLYEMTYAEARRNLKQILEKVEPADDKERADIATMLEMLQKYPNIMSQNCEIGHFTGSALVCDYNGRILLHYHKNLNRWLQFGGHPDAEFNFADVALRETIEETGLSDLHHFSALEKTQPIDFDVHVIPAKDNRPEHLHLDLRYLLLTRRPEKVNPPAGESQNYAWLKYEDIVNPTDPSDADLIEPALKRLIHKCYKKNLPNVNINASVRQRIASPHQNIVPYPRKKRHYDPPAE